MSGSRSCPVTRWCRSREGEKIKSEARARGLEFEVFGLKKHDAVRVGGTTRTLGRHSEVDDVTAAKFFDQFTEEFGKGWWR